jgi:hypothetical protein
MASRHAARLALAVGVLGGLVLARFVAPAEAARNSGGTYSLPSGQPVVSGTTISSSVFNTLTADLSTEITSSLDRSGRGAMLAPLQCSNGTVSLPSLTFGTDPDTGLYRIGANNPGFAAGGVKVWECAATGCTFPLLLAVTGAQTNAAGITVTQSTTNGAAGTFTGNGSGDGLVATGGGTHGDGITATGGATNGRGGVFAGAGSGTGLISTGGATGAGGTFVGGATSGYAVVGTASGNDNAGAIFTGNGVGAGAFLASGTAASATVSQDALNLTNGAIHFSGANPNSDVAFTNRATGANVIKAWGKLTSDGAGNVAVTSGFNIAGAVCGSTGNDSFVVTMATAMTGTTGNYVVIATSPTSSSVTAGNTSSTVFRITNVSAACDTVGSIADFIVVGLQ